MDNKFSSQKGKKKKAARILTVVGKVLGTIMLIGLITTLIFSCIFAVYVKTYLKPQVNLDLKDFSLNQTTVIYYQDSQTGLYKELQSLSTSENRIWVGYSDIPQNLINATVAIEDKRFYEHQGVDWYRTSTAFLNMFLQMKNTYGGSTITQQLIKNLSDDDEQTVRRKLIEIFRALEFENKYTKEEILEWYLNTVFYGESSYGVKTAALVYFGKDVSDLSLAECAALAGITNNPSMFDPYIDEESTISRQKIILKAMLEQGYIDENQYEAALAEKITFQRGEDESGSSSQIYSYFVDQVIREVVSDLQEKTGYSSTIVNQMVSSGGYSIYATIDPKIQAALDSVYTDLTQIPETEGSSQQLQSAMVIVDLNGNVVAMSGGVGEKEGSLTLNRAYQSYRQPGSAIKPLTVYAPALAKGLITPVTVYDDTPYSFDGGLWPKNDDRRYRGLMSISTALELSNNTIPVKLVSEMTPDYCFEYAKDKLGLSSLVEEETINGDVLSDINVAPMALGGLTNGVSVAEMASAYATFPSGGVYRSGRTYSKVLDANGNVILDNTSQSTQAMDEVSAWYMNDMLTNVVENGTGSTAKIDSMTVAGKTGTTSSDYDRWFVGYTPYYSAAVWVGYDSNEEIVLKNDVNPAAYLWQKVMAKVHEGLENKGFTQPSTLTECTICRDSGLLATQWCSADVRGSRIINVLLDASDVPTTYCACHTGVTICLKSGQIATEYCTEGTKSVGVLNVFRQFPIAGVVVEDQKYSIGGLTQTLASGYYPAVSGTTNMITGSCTLHIKPVESPSPSPSPSESVDIPSDEPGIGDVGGVDGNGNGNSDGNGNNNGNSNSDRENSEDAINAQETTPEISLP